MRFGRAAICNASRPNARAGPRRRAPRTPSVGSQKFVVHRGRRCARLAALLVVHIFPICSLLAPCQAGASPPSVHNELLRHDTRVCQRNAIETSPPRWTRTGGSKGFPKGLRLSVLGVLRGGERNPATPTQSREH